jgi:NADH/NAD ratio-sensing transcriptional regulator Rex
MPKPVSDKAAQVTVDYILEKFVDLMDSDASWNVKVRGLELLGKYLNMFQDQKKVDINVRSLIAGASLDDLRKLTGETYDIECEPTKCLQE